jgi:hypothetical protein
MLDAKINRKTAQHGRHFFMVDLFWQEVLWLGRVR